MHSKVDDFVMHEMRFADRNGFGIGCMNPWRTAYGVPAIAASMAAP